jgi:hypothetical protein
MHVLALFASSFIQGAFVRGNASTSDVRIELSLCGEYVQVLMHTLSMCLFLAVLDTPRTGDVFLIVSKDGG